MVSIQIAGVEYRQETIANIRIMLGRTRVTDPGLPSSCQLEIHTPAAPTVQYGDTVTVTDPVYGPRFTGHVTNAEMDHIEETVNGTLTRLAVVTVQAMGALAGWGRNRIGDTPWPQETLSARAARIAALVGEPLIVQGGEDLTIIPRDIDSKPAVEVIVELADGSGAWLFDTPNGDTVMQAVDYRRIGSQVTRWQDVVPLWDEWEGTWAEQNDYSPAFPRPITPGPDIVVYEPKWIYSAALANQITVAYGVKGENDEQATVYVEDAESVAAFKPHAVKVETPLAFNTDATMRGHLILERAARPQWHLTDVTIDLHHIADAAAGPYRDLIPGIRCDLAGLPLPAPSNGFNGVVEGWQETYQAAGGSIGHWLTLALSDARWSYAVLSWDGMPPETLWSDIDVAWQEMNTVEDLGMVA